MRTNTLLLCCMTACATTGPAVPEPPSLAEFVRPEVTQDDLELVVKLTRDLIQVRSVNPPTVEGAQGGEAALAKVLVDFFKGHGIDARVQDIEGLPGRPAVIAGLKPKHPRKRPLLLLGHTDVVPAVAEEWRSRDLPFSGREEAGEIWGRGALDMKGMLAIQAMTMVQLKRLATQSKSYRLDRAVYFAAVPDEEDLGRGARWLAKNLEALFGEVPEYGINEGGFGLKDLLRPGQDVWAVSAAERGHHWLRLRVTRQSGHASQPWPGFAIQDLTEGLARLRAQPFDIELRPEAREMLRRTAVGAGFPKAFFMERGWFVTGAMTRRRSSNASVRNTCVVTSLQAGGPRPNVVPSKASAVLDCRTLPGTDSAAFLESVKERLAVDGVKIEVIDITQGTASPWTSQLFGAFERHLTGGVVVPVVSPGSTDSSFLREAGVDYVYGITPIMITSEELATLHGAHERVRRKELGAGLLRLTRILIDVCVAKRPQMGS